MALTSAQKIFGKIAAVLGALQGLTWICMSLACIIVYNSEKVIETTSTSYTAVLNALFYQFYLTKTLDVGSIYNFVIRPKDFQVFMWFYFFFSVALLSASVDLFFAVHQNKNRQSKLMVIWGILTGCISIIDLIFTFLLLRDFNNCPDLSSTVSSTLQLDLLCHTAVGIPMTLAAKGFMLWAVNVFLTHMLIVSGIQIITHVRVKNAVQNITIPRAKVQQQTPPMTPDYGNYPSQVPLEQPQRFQRPQTLQNNPNEYPSFIHSGNRMKY